MGRLDLPDKYRDEDATERRRLSRRVFNTLTGRRSSDLDKPRWGVCDECGSGLLDGKHIADYDCSSS